MTPLPPPPIALVPACPADAPPAEVPIPEPPVVVVPPLALDAPAVPPAPLDVPVVSSVPGESELDESEQPKLAAANRIHQDIDAVRGLMLLDPT